MNTPFEKRICYTLCVCEMTAVLSCVSIFYLTFGVYLPSYRQLNAGFTEEPVMCTTKSNITLENCEIEQGSGVTSWSSCGEWCLSKSGGSCTQIRVDVRHNGTNVRLEGCEQDKEDVIYCDGIDPKQETKECITGGCAGLTGLYNCSQHPVSEGVTEAEYGAWCRDLSNVLGCNLTSVDPGVHCKTKKACLYLNGLYLCRRGHCSRVRPPFKCEKKCTGIKTDEKNIVIRENDVIFTHKCKRAVNMATGEEIWPRNFPGFMEKPEYLNENGSVIEVNFQDPTLNPLNPEVANPNPNPTNIAMTKRDTENQQNSESEIAENSDDPSNSNSNLPPVLVMYCTSVIDRQMNLTEIRMLDCFNGTLMEPTVFGERTDIKTLVKKHTENWRLLDPVNKTIAPIESDLLISTDAPLYINYEGCVNTLILRECEQFYAQYGVDGSDLRTNARFPCFYRPNFTDTTEDANFVIIRYDIERTMLELLLASIIPVVLAVISCTMLVLCSKLVHVDDSDQLLYIQMCNKTFKPQIEETEVVKKI